MRRGETWERRLERRHDEYRRDRRAVILRCHPEVRIVHRAGAAVSGRLGADGPPDFLGVVCGSGRAVAAEAKTTVKSYLPMAMIPRHQAMDLSAYDEAGALALVLASLGGTEWVLDWHVVGPTWWAGATAWRPNDPGGRAMIDADWLTALG